MADGDHTHTATCCMIQLRGVYDGGAYYACSDGINRHRWPEGHPVRERLAQAIPESRRWP